MTDVAGRAARLGRRALSLVTAFLMAVAALGAPAATQALTAGPCPTTSSGVTVVVDFSAFGAGSVVRCAPGDPATGFAALAGAGFSIEQVRNVPGFLCRIDGSPGAGQESCVNTPPASAYWVYWNAPRGGTWTYSSSGAATRNPAVGTVEGWSFSGPGGVGAPNVPPPPPPAAPKATPAPLPPAPAPTAPDTPPPTSRPAGATAAPMPRAATAAPSATSRTGPSDSPDASGLASMTPSSRPTASPFAVAGTWQSSARPSPSDAVVAAANATPAPPAIPLGTAVGLTIAVAVGGAAAVVVRRRAAGT